MKKFKPTTPGRRGMTGIDYSSKTTAKKPLKSLTFGRKSSKGRNSFGRITSRHRGGGYKRRFRDIDLKLDKRDIPFEVKTIEYDPNRSGFIGLVSYKDGEKRYILLPEKVVVGDELLISDNAPLRAGNRLKLANVPVGTFVFGIEIQPGGGSKLARSAGSSAEVVAKDAGYVDLKMPSSEVRKVKETCWATIGEVSNHEHNQVVIGKAGRSRLMGRRPKVRGSAMNPVDHPYGGGEGRAGRGMRREKTKWGKPAGKRQKTRKPKKYSNKLIVKRRKVGKKR
ncbi:MAG: 50S ribosomal protein L2 [Candidatus Paceibacterota bacterium]